MTLDQYLAKHRLTKTAYFKKEVEKIRAHAFVAALMHKKRSNPQNRYYFGVVLPFIGNEIGYTSEEAHQAYKEEFLSYEKNGKKFTRSTASLDVQEFEQYLKQIRRHAAEFHGIVIPLPNEEALFV